MHSELNLDPNSMFFVLDFDRTLANTDKFHEVLEQVIGDKTNLSTDFLGHARYKAEHNGQSFDTISYLRNYLNETNADISWPDLQREFVLRARQLDMLEPGASDLLAALDERQFRYGILTYGGEAWQLLKLEAANLINVPRFVTHIHEKGLILSEWKQETGNFLIPPALTKDFKMLNIKQIVFLDDKSLSFNHIPEGVMGIRVRPPEGLTLEAQKGELPPGVVEVEGLEGAIRLLFE